MIGDPIRHSLSPVVLNAAFRELGLDWVYVALEVPAGAAPAAVAGARALGVAGLSVTTPHKEAVAALVDDLAPEAALLGAVNCVVRRGDRLLGETTDGRGFLDAVRLEHAFDPAGRRCVVRGAGGAARAVVLALAGGGAAEVVVVAGRDPGRAAVAAALAGPGGRVGGPHDARGADLVVNATVLGMAGAPDELPLDPRLLGPGQVVVDLVYPLTPFVVAARDRGAQAGAGVGMLVHQAAHALRLWTGAEPPLGAMAAAARAALDQRR